MWCCALCGTAIEDDAEHAWKKECRAVYALGSDLSTARLSGIGRTLHFTLYVLEEPHRRYDNADLRGNLVGYVRVDDTYHYDRPRPAPDGSPVPRVWGSVFHAACWDILTSLNQPDVQLLFDLCFSMPIHGTGILDWGHQYGGAVSMGYRYGREYGTVQLRNRDLPDPSSTFDRDPYEIPSILKLFRSTVSLKYNRFKTPAPGIPVNTGGDVFQRLPNELLEAILVKFPRKDVGHLRRASPVYANYQLPEAFWASRFRKGHEFHHVFETFRSRPDSWRNPYLSLRSIEKRLPALLHRKRIWGMALELDSLLTQMSGTVCEGARLPSTYSTSEPWSIEGNEHTLGGGILKWHTAAVALGKQDKSFHVGCRPLYARILRFPSGLQVHQLWVSFTQMNDGFFVSGFRFVGLDGQVNRLGYIHPNQEVKICFSDERHQSPYSISGWQLAIDNNNGFRAVAVLTDEGEMSRWAGEPGEVPRWRLAGLEQEISAIKAEFDALKLVSLSRNVSPWIDDNRFFNRNNYSWKPDVPPDDVLLSRPNEALGFGNPRLNLSTIVFGGPRGEHLSQLAEIVIYTCCYYVFCIEFLYMDSAKNMLIGDPSFKICLHHGPHQRSKHSMPIDGPGGERIQDVTSSSLSMVDGLLIRTTYGRKMLFGDPKRRRGVPQPSFGATGSLPIGLFVKGGLPLRCLGMMSINLENSDSSSEAREGQGMEHVETYSRPVTRSQTRERA